MYGIESTIVRLERGVIHVMREGSFQDLDKIRNDNPDITVKIFNMGDKLQNRIGEDILNVPGQYDKHYSPNIACYMLNND